MAKSHKAKVAKFCVVETWPRYDARDAIVGHTSRRRGCFRSAAKANAAAQRLYNRYGGSGADDVHIRVTGPRTLPKQHFPHRRLRTSLPF